MAGKENINAKNILVTVALIVSIAISLIGVTLYASEKVSRAEFAPIKEKVIRHDEILPRIERTLDRIDKRLEKMK